MKGHYVKNDFNSIFRIHKSEDYRKRFKREFIDVIDKFYEVLNKEALYIDLSLFKQNLKTLKIRKYKFFIGYTKDTSGLYLNKENIIKILKLESLYHELLHVASTFIKDNYAFVGFSQKDFKHNVVIGQGLNEGYTALLEKRYFKKSDSYVVERHFASLIEEIIGREKMEQLYFRADLYGLSRELRKYDSAENIVQFLNNLDYLSENIELLSHGKDNALEQQITKKLEECSEFCLKCLCKKVDNQIANGLLCEKEVDKEVLRITTRICTRFSNQSDSFLLQALPLSKANDIVQDSFCYATVNYIDTKNKTNSHLK